MSRHIFISYRRADSEGYAGRLFDRLRSHFGERNIFMDVVAIDAGVNFAREIEQAVQSCDVLLALIGPQWVTVKDGQGKLRLGDLGDYVRLEIGIALARGIRVVPVLIQGASMPQASALPENLKPLAMRNAIELSSTRFHADADRLVEAIERAMDEAERERNTPAPVPPSAFRSLHQLPQPPADFTGREELIAQLLTDFESGKGATITGLTGMGGIGKTALGLVVAHRVSNEYPDAQIFLDLKGTTEPLSAADAMRHVVLSFEPAADLRALGEGGMSNAYRSVLHGKRVLLFLDNARSAEQIAPLRPPETCAMLVTSRWTFSVPGLHTRRLDVMSEENAIAFLLELCPRVGGHTAALARACGYLPLALRIAGSFLDVNRDWAIETYLAQLADRKQRLSTLKQSREGAELTTEPDLLATFELSYGQLAEEDRRRWRMLGIFPTSFDWNAANALWDLKVVQPRKTLGLLLRYSLLDYDEISSRYSLHDLLADYALSQMNPEEEHQAHLRHASYYKDVLSAANELFTEGGEKVLNGVRLFDLEWENIRTGQSWVSITADRTQDITELCMAYPESGSSVLGLRLHPRQQIRWLEAALSAARKSKDRPREMRALSSLGSAYDDLGEFRKAIEFHEQALAIEQETGDHLMEGLTLNSLGTVYSKFGEVHRAIEFHEQALGLAREIGDRAGEGLTLGSLGSAYYYLGEFHKAIEFHEQALAIAREVGDRSGEGHRLGDLGLVYHDLGEFGKAVEFHEQALAIVREIGNRYNEGLTLNSLGLTYSKFGEVHRAIEFHEQALDLAQEIGDRRSEALTLFNLGVAYYYLGEFRKAIKFYEQGLTIAREIGDRHSEANTLFVIGLGLYELEEKDRAVQHVKQALEIFEAIASSNAEQARSTLKEWGE